MNEKLLSESGLLSETDACRLLNVSRSTLWRWRKAGKVRYFRLGTKVGYMLTHLHEFLHGCERKEQPAAEASAQ